MSVEPETGLLLFDNYHVCYGSAFLSASLNSKLCSSLNRRLVEGTSLLISGDAFVSVRIIPDVWHHALLISVVC